MRPIRLKDYAEKPPLSSAVFQLLVCPPIQYEGIGKNRIKPGEYR
jgi:hypothetical protein